MKYVVEGVFCGDFVFEVYGFCEEWFVFIVGLVFGELVVVFSFGKG